MRIKGKKLGIAVTAVAVVAAMIPVAVFGMGFTGGVAGMLGRHIVRKVELSDEQKAEMKEKFIEKINQAVQDGKLTQEQADEAIANFESGKPVSIRLGGDGGEMRIMMNKELTDEEKTEMEAKMEERRAEMKAAMQEKLAKAVEEGSMTQEQADEMLENFDNGEMKFGMRFKGGETGELSELPELPCLQDCPLVDGEQKSVMKFRFDGKELTDEEKAEMEAKMEERRAEMKVAMQEKLAKAVEEGKLTQEQADEILAKYENGEMSMFGKSVGRRRGFGGGMGMKNGRNAPNIPTVEGTSL